MGVIIIISILCFALIVGLIWLVIYFPTKWIFPQKKLKTIRWTVSILLGSIVICYLLFTSPAYNHENASINQKGDIFELRFAGERIYMSHDPISALSRRTFTDTFILNLPRNKGVIRGNEIIKQDGYPLLGKIEIKKGKVMVNLFYDNFDDHIKDPLDYNGIYKLKTVYNTK